MASSRFIVGIHAGSYRVAIIQARQYRATLAKVTGRFAGEGGFYD